jgi:hypothetical protein
MDRQFQVGGSHYTEMAVQPWDAMESWLTWDQWEGYLLGTVIAYLARYNSKADGKGGLQDLRKAHHVLGKLLDEYDQGTP